MDLSRLPKAVSASGGKDANAAVPVRLPLGIQVPSHASWLLHEIKTQRAITSQQQTEKTG